MNNLSSSSEWGVKYFSLLLTAFFIGFVFVGAQTAGSEDVFNFQRRETDSETRFSPGPSIPPAATLDESPLLIDEVTPEKMDDDEMIFPEREPEEPEKAFPPSDYEARMPFPERLIEGVGSPEEIVNVSFNFDATPLTEVVPMFASLLDFNYLIAPDVEGAVTMNLNTEMSARQVWRMFEHLLWLSGAYVSENEGFVHVLPFQRMPSERRLLMDIEPRANVEVAIIPIKHAESSNMVEHLQPFITEGATVSNLSRLNSLLVVEAPANMPKLRALIDKLDSRGEAKWPHISIRCREVDVEIIREELESLLPILGMSVTDSTPAAGDVKIIALPRLQAIVASAPLEEVLEEVKRWVRLLDRDDAAERENIYFYNVHHSTAEQLAEVLQVFFGETAAETGTRPSETRGVSARADEGGGRDDERERSWPERRPAPRQSDNPSSNNGIETVFDTPLTMYVDGVQNRLTIRTTRRAYAMIEALLRRLDVPPRQVLIQGIIADIQLEESLEYGFSYAAMDKYEDYIVRHAFVGSPDGFQDPRDISDGFAFRLRKSEDKIGFLRAVAGDSNVRVLSAPQIMATSDEEARINIGDRVPVVTGDYTDLRAVDEERGAIRRSIEYTDVGVIMTVTPYITAGNQVKLVIQQEVSDAIETATSGIDSPTIRTRELSTTLNIEDGGTALLGGLIRSQDDESYYGIPILMNIPVLGHLFRSTETSTRRTELLVLFTVNVVESQDMVERLTERYQQALKRIREDIDL